MSDLLKAAKKIPGSLGGQDIPFLPEDDGWREVCRYPATAEDGMLAVAYVHRMPACFWQVAVPAAGLSLMLGSGTDELAEQIALAIASGDLSIELVASPPGFPQSA